MIPLKQDLLAGLELKVLAIQRAEARCWWNFRQVTSPFARLWLVLAGQAEVRHHGREFTLTPGKIHLVPPFTSHDCSCPWRLDHFFLHFVSRLQTGVDLFSLLDHEFELPATPEVLKQFERLEAIYPNRKLPCFDPSREEYRPLLLAAEQADHEMSAVDWFEGKGLQISLLSPFLRTARERPGVHTRAARQFLAVQEFIHANMSRNISLADLARAARLHPAYFSDRFRDLVGVRPLEYLMQCRLERAQFLLITTVASVKEIAAQVGFRDAAYFTRAFSRGCGRSPTAYRSAHTS